MRGAPGIAVDSSTGGAPFGEIVHRTLERADLADPASAARALDEALAAITGSAPGATRDFALALDDAGRARLGLFLERVLRDREVAQLARSPRLHREVPFVLPAGGDFVTGAVDLLIEGTDGSLWIFDYKTDRIVPRSAAELPLRYRRQALLSSLALATITGRPVRAFRFLFVAADPVIPITIDIDDDVLAEARSLIQKVRSIPVSILPSTRDGAR
jgi:ATP-dependent exoDNAse (exonuclease V) beta subunit